MLSDQGILQALKRGTFSIEPYTSEALQACSYDIEIERIYRVVDYSAHEEMSIEQFIEKHCMPYDGVLHPGQFYIGVSRERVLAPQHMLDVITRSSMARLGIDMQFMEQSASGKMYFAMNTFGTAVQVPEGQRMAQIVLEKYIPLGREAIMKLVDEGRLKSSRELQILSENAELVRFSMPRRTFDMVMLHLGNAIKVYNGSLLRYDEPNDGSFDEQDITSIRFVRRFFLASSEEFIEMPVDHAGVLRRQLRDMGKGMIDANSYLVQPGSRAQQVFEMHFPEGRYVRRGEPIAGIEIHPLDQPSSRPYNSHKYQGQRGPQPSRLHIDARNANQLLL